MTPPIAITNRKDRRDHCRFRVLKTDGGGGSRNQTLIAKLRTTVLLM